MTKTTTVAAAFVALSAPAFADFQGLSERHDDVNVSILQQIGDAGRSVLSVPGRVAGVNDGLPPMLSAGTQEFGFAGNVNFADDILYNLNLSYGWFIKDRWQVGFRAGLQGGESTDDNISLGLFTEYNFCINETSKWVPFVGFSANWLSVDSDAFSSDSIGLGLDLGIKYFIRENIALSFSLGAQFALDDLEAADDFQEQINIGTRFYF